VEYTILILFGFVAGWGEQKNAYGWLCTGEDMSGSPQNFIFYEIVRAANLMLFQHCALLQSSPFTTTFLLLNHQANECKLLLLIQVYYEIS
jgi:hypothetical protein